MGVEIIRCALSYHVFSVRDNLYSPVELKYLTRVSAEINIGQTTSLLASIADAGYKAR